MTKKTLIFTLGLLGLCTPLQGFWARFARRCVTPNALVNAAALTGIVGKGLWDRAKSKQNALRGAAEASETTKRFVQETAKNCRWSARDIARLSIRTSPSYRGFYVNGFSNSVHVPSRMIDFDVAQTQDDVELPKDFNKDQQDLDTLSVKERKDYYKFTLAHELYHLKDGHSKKTFFADLFSRISLYGIASACAYAAPVAIRLPFKLGAVAIACTAKKLFPRDAMRRQQELQADASAIRHSDSAVLRARAKAFRALHKKTCGMLLKQGLLRQADVHRYNTDEKFREQIWQQKDNVHPSALTRALRIEKEIKRREKSN